MWKSLFAIVVSTAVITTSVYLYRHRDEMFRPDVRKLGGTRIVFTVESGKPDDDYLTAMRRRFDPRGKLGVVVRKGDSDEVEFLVPHGTEHADMVARIERIAGRPGKFAFLPIASLNADESVAKHAQTAYAGKKAMPRTAPPPPPVNSLGGRDFANWIVGAAPRHYRWVRLGEIAIVSLRLDPATLAGANIAEKSAADRAVRTGALLHPSAQPGAMLLAARLPDEADPALFLLVRDDSDEHAITASHIRRVEGEKVARGPSSIRLRLEAEGVQRLSAIRQQQDSLHVYSRVGAPTGPVRLIALLIDDQVAALPIYALDQRSEALLEFGVNDDELDDIACLLRSIPQGVRLSRKPLRSEPLEPVK